MKNKKILFILIGIFAVCFIGASILFALQGLSAGNKKQEYFDVYRAKAEEYIKSDFEIVTKYGDNVSVKFDDSVTYMVSEKRGLFDVFMEVFSPSVPDTLEEFTNGMEMITFKVKINGNLYEIAFEKNSVGELSVSSLTEIKQ